MESTDTIDTHRSWRLDAWALLTVLSTIVLATYLSGAYTVHAEWPGDGGDEYSYGKWEPAPDSEAALITACAATSLTLGALEAVAHMICTKARHVDASFLASLILAVLWGFALPFIMDPQIHLAQTRTNRSGHYVNDYQVHILNGNMFFFSWGSALIAFGILVDAVASYMPKNDDSGGHRAAQPVRPRKDTDNDCMKWLLLMVACAVVVGESVRFENDICPIKADLNAGKVDYWYDDEGEEEVPSHWDLLRDPNYGRTPVYSTCNKNEIGLYTGIVGLCVAFLTLVLVSILSYVGSDQLVGGFEAAKVKHFTRSWCGFVTTIAGALTFYEGPATYASNQWFAAWAAFFISISMPWAAVKEWVMAGEAEKRKLLSLRLPRLLMMQCQWLWWLNRCNGKRLEIECRKNVDERGA